MSRERSTRPPNSGSANIGFEAKLWLAADKLVASESEYAANPEDPDEYCAENIFWVHSFCTWL